MKKKVFCKDCNHFRTRQDRWRGYGIACTQGSRDFIEGGRFHTNPRKKNPKGKCKDYIKKPKKRSFLERLLGE